MKKLIATRSIVADRRYNEGEKLELDDIHADPLIACGAAVLAPVEPPPAPPAKATKGKKAADPEPAAEPLPGTDEQGAAL